MKVKGLIEQLQRMSPDAEIEIPISVFTRDYPVAYTQITAVMDFGDDVVRIHTSLPDNMHVVTRKVAP